MIRAVVLPFGKGGIIGGTMLGLGRALGETIAVLLIINQVFEIKPNVLETGTATVPPPSLRSSARTPPIPGAGGCRREQFRPS